jgi:hypothetical protein
MQLMYDVDEDDPYNRFQLIDAYDRHIYNVQRYFRQRPDVLLTINIGEEDSVDRPLAFVGVPLRGATMPHLNRSEEEGPLAPSITPPRARLGALR